MDITGENNELPTSVSRIGTPLSAYSIVSEINKTRSRGYSTQFTQERIIRSARGVKRESKFNVQQNTDSSSSKFLTRSGEGTGETIKGENEKGFGGDAKNIGGLEFFPLSLRRPSKLRVPLNIPPLIIPKKEDEEMSLVRSDNPGKFWFTTTITPKAPCKIYIYIYIYIASSKAQTPMTPTILGLPGESLMMGSTYRNSTVRVPKKTDEQILREKEEESQKTELAMTLSNLLEKSKNIQLPDVLYKGNTMPLSLAVLAKKRKTLINLLNEGIDISPALVHDITQNACKKIVIRYLEQNNKKIGIYIYIYIINLDRRMKKKLKVKVIPEVEEKLELHSPKPKSPRSPRPMLSSSTIQAKKRMSVITPKLGILGLKTRGLFKSSMSLMNKPKGEEFRINLGKTKVSRTALTILQQIAKRTTTKTYSDLTESDEDSFSSKDD